MTQNDRPSCPLIPRGILAFLLIGTLLAGTATINAAVTIQVDSSTQHQTMRGWGSVFPWQTDIPDHLVDSIIEIGVNDLGINCFRYECPAGWSTAISRLEWTNDDADPTHINWDALNLADLDTKVTKWVVPIKQAVEARGEPFYMQVSPSWFEGGSSGAAPEWLLRSPGEYAEWAMSVLLRLRDEHGIEADYYTVCNEMGNGNLFTPGTVARMIKALGPIMRDAGFATMIQFPEAINAYAAWDYINRTQTDARMWQYVGVISYHLYGGTDYRDDLWAFASPRGLETAQTEFLASFSFRNVVDHLYNDLTITNVSEWEVYGQAFPVVTPTKTSYTRSTHWWLFRQFMPYVRPGAVRIEATSDTSTVRALSFVNNGAVTTLLLNTSTTSVAQTATLTGLPQGEYAVSQSINDGVVQELGVRTVGPDGMLTVSLPNTAVLTVYPHTENLPPLPTHWGASNNYLQYGGTSYTTLSAEAQDPELDSLTYTWNIVDQPAGASAALATPTAASCIAFDLSVPGLYTFSIDISDGQNTVTRKVMLKVFDGNQPPIFGEVHIRKPVQLILPTTSATLRCDASDVEGDTITYLWTVESHPAGATPTLASPTSTSCIVSGLTVAGEYLFRASASDGQNTTYADLPVTVFPADEHAPVITNTAASVTTGGFGRLSANTSDADGHWISHWWEMTSGPDTATVRFSDQGAKTTAVWTDTPGTYRFQLNAVGPNRYAVSPSVTVVLGASPAPIPGDANFDGTVDLVDFVILKMNFGATDATTATGDFDGDGDVDLADFVILKRHFGSSL